MVENASNTWPQFSANKDIKPQPTKQPSQCHQLQQTLEETPLIHTSFCTLGKKTKVKGLLQDSMDVKKHKEATNA